jgi:hypothetical protein
MWKSERRVREQGARWVIRRQWKPNCPLRVIDMHICVQLHIKEYFTTQKN